MMLPSLLPRLIPTLCFGGLLVAKAASYLQARILKAIKAGLTPLKRLATTLLKQARSILNDCPPHQLKANGRHQQQDGWLTRLANGYRDTEFLFILQFSFKLSGV